MSGSKLLQELETEKKNVDIKIMTFAKKEREKKAKAEAKAKAKAATASGSAASTDAAPTPTKATAAKRALQQGQVEAKRDAIVAQAQIAVIPSQSPRPSAAPAAGEPAEEQPSTTFVEELVKYFNYIKKLDPRNEFLDSFRLLFLFAQIKNGVTVLNPASQSHKEIKALTVLRKMIKRLVYKKAGLTIRVSDVDFDQGTDKDNEL